MGAYYHPLFQKDNFRLCMQMSCINSKEPQAIQSMNPVALGLMVPASPTPAQMGMMMMMAPDPSIFNPAQMALLHNGQNQLYQQQQQQLNHHGIMALAEMHNQAAGQQQGLVPFERASSSAPSDTQNQLYQQQLNLHASMVMAATHNQAGQQQQQQQQQQQGVGISERASSSGPSRTSTDVSSSTEAVAALNQGQGNPPVAMSVSRMQLQQLAASSELNRAPQGGAAGANGDQDGGWFP
jgi:hypothetical protein